MASRCSTAWWAPRSPSRPLLCLNLGGKGKYTHLEHTSRLGLDAWVRLMDEPVLAQREAMQAAQERSAVDTRSMGAGSTKLLREVFTKEQLEQQRALDAADDDRVEREADQG